MTKWIETKRTGDVLIEHVGDFTSSYLDSVIPKIEEKLKDSIDFECVRKKAFHIFIECAQNLFHHIEPIKSLSDDYGSDRLGAIFLAKDGPFCRISTGNFIPKEKEESLKEQIDKINSSTEVEIRALYRETMNNRHFSEKGGAGIGMIDMARKSGNKLVCTFYTVKDQPMLLFFSFDVCIC